MGFNVTVFYELIVEAIFQVDVSEERLSFKSGMQDPFIPTTGKPFEALRIKKTHNVHVMEVETPLKPSNSMRRSDKVVKSKWNQMGCSSRKV